MKSFATYTYLHREVDGRYTEHTMLVEIMKFAGSRALVQYKGFHANGAKVNTLHWVGKNKLALSGIASTVGLSVKDPVSLREVRLPYKDND